MTGEAGEIPQLSAAAPMNRLTLARLADTLAHAQRVWKDRDQALDFLTRKHAMLEQRKPVDLVLEVSKGHSVCVIY